MNRRAIHHHIDTHLEEHIARIQRWVRQKSVSWDNLGVEQCAELVAKTYGELGCAEVEILEGRFHPGVWAFYDAGRKATVHNYCMFDTRPARQKGWKYDPWGAELVASGPYPKVLVGRGAMIAKGPYVAWLNALSSIIAVEGTLPVNIMFLAEGDEIMGSPSYMDFVLRKSDQLGKVSASFCASSSQDERGDVSVGLGLKGMIVIELKCSAENWGYGPKVAVHSQGAGLIHNPVFRLAQAIATLTNEDGSECKVLGLDKVMRSRKPLTAEEQSLIDVLATRFKGRDWRDVIPLGGARNVDHLIGSPQDSDPLISWLYGPTFNISGIYGGFLGPGTSTIPFIVPSEARAMLDMRLVTSTPPKEIISLVRTHLDNHGFADVTVDVYSSFSHSQTSVSHPAVQATIKTLRDWNANPVIWPIQATGGPWTAVPHLFNVPCIRGSALGGGGSSETNEYMIIEGDGKVAGLAEAEKYYVDLLYNIAPCLE